MPKHAFATEAERDALLIALYSDGVSDKRLCERLRFSNAKLLDRVRALDAQGLLETRHPAEGGMINRQDETRFLELYERNLSFGAIATVMGVTINVVAGYVFRRVASGDLPRRETNRPLFGAAAVSTAHARARLAGRAGQPQSPASPEFPPLVKSPPLEEANQTTCNWVEEQPSGSGAARWLSCDNPAAVRRVGGRTRGLSFCKHHASLCYVSRSALPPRPYIPRAT